ncbi:hypothetical protein XENOCAPTIV_027870, partial [Xenoophorus captivus]
MSQCQNNQSKSSRNQCRFGSSVQPRRDNACSSDSTLRMSCKINFSPLLRKTPQRCSKLCDVTLKSSMGGQTVLSEAEGAELCTSETSLYSSLSLKAHQRPGGMDKLLRRCRIRTPIIRECLAECLGVYVLI